MAQYLYRLDREMVLTAPSPGHHTTGGAVALGRTPTFFNVNQMDDLMDEREVNTLDMQRLITLARGAANG